MYLRNSQKFSTAKISRHTVVVLLHVHCVQGGLAGILLSLKVHEFMQGAWVFIEAPGCNWGIYM